MKVSASIEINVSKEKLWEVVTDYSKWKSFITSILDVEVLEEAVDSFKGFKWKETRMMFGKEATEVMWVTDFEVNSYYKTRAESHGSVYESTVEIKENGATCILTQGFEGFPQKIMGKIMMGLMGSMMNKSTEKALYKDLEDIKKYAETL